MSATSPSAFRAPLSEPPPVVFVNPAAGSGRAARNIPRIRVLFERHGCRADFLETRSRSELEDRAARFLEQGRRTFLTAGGDGTLQGLVQALLGHDALIGVLPVGSGNDFASALGFPLDLTRAVELLFACVPRRVDLAIARTADGSARVYVGGGGIGLDAEAARYAASHYRRFSGKIRYVASALRAWKHFEALHVRAQCRGLTESNCRELQGDVLVACVLNSPTYGGGLRLAPNARLDDGLLDLTLLESLELPQVLRRVPRLLATGQITTPAMQRVQCARVGLQPDRPCFFHGDGEIFGPAPVEIAVLPGALRVLAPRSATQPR